MTSSNQIYIITTEGGNLFFLAFDYSNTATITPTYYQSYANYQSASQSITTSAMDYVYIAGSMSNKITLLKLKSSDGTLSN